MTYEYVVFKGDGDVLFRECVSESLHAAVVSPVFQGCGKKRLQAWVVLRLNYERQQFASTEEVPLKLLVSALKKKIKRALTDRSTQQRPPRWFHALFGNPKLV